MAAEITLFANTGEGNGHQAQVAKTPIASYNTSFTAAQGGLIRVWANGAPVVLTISNLAWTIPTGGVEYFGIPAGQAVFVS